MTSLFPSLIAAAVIFAALAWVAIWSRRADPMRHVAVLLFLVGLPALGYAGVSSLSWSRPHWAMWGLSGDFRVLGAKMIMGEAIYVYVDTGEGEPRSVALPWSAAMAKQMQDLFDDPANEGQAVMKFEWSWDTHQAPTFYPLPQPAIPLPKEPQNAAPHIEI